MTEILVEHGSVADADADLLVNASNTVLQLGSGVSAAIRGSCGVGFQERLDGLMRQRFPSGIEPGAVVVTDAGLHPRAKWIAHVAVMDFRAGKDLEPRPDLERIEKGVRELWSAIEQIDADAISVAMVGLGAGTGGIRLRDSIEAACKSLRAHLDAFPQSRMSRVIFTAWEQREYADTISVVKNYFPLDLDALDPEVRRLVDSFEA